MDFQSNTTHSDGTTTNLHVQMSGLGSSAAPPQGIGILNHSGDSAASAPGFGQGRPTLSHPSFNTPGAGAASAPGFGQGRPAHFYPSFKMIGHVGSDRIRPVVQQATSASATPAAASAPAPSPVPASAPALVARVHEYGEVLFGGY
jgi:hypothetical protein